MKKKWTPNQLAQFLASVGVVVGLILVIFEIRENNAIAYQQAVSGNWQNWNEVYSEEMQPDFAAAWEQAMTNADELTLQQKIILNAYLFAVTGAYHQDLSALELSGDMDTVTQILDWLETDAQVYFANPFSRGWFRKNSYWMDPKVADAIEKGIARYPLGSDLKYYEEMIE